MKMRRFITSKLQKPCSVLFGWQCGATRYLYSYLANFSFTAMASSENCCFHSWSLHCLHILCWFKKCVHVAKTCRRGAGTRRCSNRNRSSQSDTGTAAEAGHMIGLLDYVPTHPRCFFATCTKKCPNLAAEIARKRLHSYINLPAKINFTRIFVYAIDNNMLEQIFHTLEFLDFWSIKVMESVHSGFRILSSSRLLAIIGQFVECCKRIWL